jgi:DNA-binding transcriptional MerR regulator
MATSVSQVFSIGVLVDRYGVSAESLRNWERAGLFPPAARTPGGHRRYTLDHIRAIDRIITAPLTLPGEGLRAN